jgi:cell fate regulator YaaT (PSP1 superfamily)
MNQQQEDNSHSPAEESRKQEQHLSHYKVQFRPAEQLWSAATRLHELQKGEVVMVQTDHGLEPARLVTIVPLWPEKEPSKETAPLTIIRRATRDEAAKYEKLGDMERNAFRLCAELIEKLNLPMNLVKVERFFNGGKIIFYFTAESRVDFRELVKNLVQEFRTRVEMRQIGVRHETKMLGGLGCCGRELCCSSFIQNFEYKTYKSIRKNMPKVGKKITLNDQQYKVRQHNVLTESIVVSGDEGEELTLSKEEWQAAVPSASKEK